MTSAWYWLRVTKTDDFYKVTSIAEKAVGYGLEPDFVCSRGLFGDYWLCRITMRFDERDSDSTDRRRVEEIGNLMVLLAGDVALASDQEIDAIFDMYVVQI